MAGGQRGETLDATVPGRGNVERRYKEPDRTRQRHGLTTSTTWHVPRHRQTPRHWHVPTLLALTGTNTPHSPRTRIGTPHWTHPLDTSTPRLTDPPLSLLWDFIEALGVG